VRRLRDARTRLKERCEETSARLYLSLNRQASLLRCTPSLSILVWYNFAKIR
jgi:hypothetical protein